MRASSTFEILSLSSFVRCACRQICDVCDYDLMMYARASARRNDLKPRGGDDDDDDVCAMGVPARHEMKQHFKSIWTRTLFQYICQSRHAVAATN